MTKVILLLVLSFSFLSSGYCQHGEPAFREKICRYLQESEAVKVVLLSMGGIAVGYFFCGYAQRILVDFRSLCSDAATAAIIIGFLTYFNPKKL